MFGKQYIVKNLNSFQSDVPSSEVKTHGLQGVN